MSTSTAKEGWQDFILHKVIRIAVPAMCALFVITSAVQVEVRTSRLQAAIFSSYVENARFELAPGPSEKIIFPADGPYFIRHGYVRIPRVVDRLSRANFSVESQMRVSNRFKEIVDRGFYPVYHTKPQAGLRIDDSHGQNLYSALRPAQIYESFDSIPRVLLDALLFIENREILDRRFPYRNPAVEWDRFTRAAIENMLEKIVPGLDAPGGSTIATQMEKYRFSHEGRTNSVRDKFIQMMSASMRAYLDGADTTEARKRIVLDYVNSIPLAALPGYGEVNGLAEGVWAWYGEDFDRFNAQVASIAPAAAVTEEQARAFVQALSLFVAHRRPSYFLLESGGAALDALTREHIRILAKAGVISPELHEAALAVVVKRRKRLPKLDPVSFVTRKASNAVRTRLLQVLDIDQLYELDQVDLTVQTTIDRAAHDAVTSVLEEITDGKLAEQYGLRKDRTLARGDPAKVIYSFTLYERAGNANLLRVQTDSVDRPFDLNEGDKLDLGSTAKLRTLVTYLQVIEQLYLELAAATGPERKEIVGPSPDALTRWAAEFMKDNPRATLTETLNAAMQRRYSASPHEQFFTGGGIHTFVNFKREDDGGNPTVSEALRRSINLPFIRIMRDVSKYFMARLSGVPGVLGRRGRTDLSPQAREAYLRRFADSEGTEFLATYYREYRDVSSREILSRFLRAVRPTPKRLAVVFRSTFPEADVEQFLMFARDHNVRGHADEKILRKAFTDYDPQRFNWNDRGFLVKRHPIELWLVGYLARQRGREPSWPEIVQASAAVRQEAYQWLFQPSKKHAQDIRIRTLIERDAFQEIHRSWARTGYPFRSIVPSLASAIGSAGDRPASLAELAGIIIAGGVRYPEVRLEKLRFAEGTPFETNIRRNPSGVGERVLSPEVAAVLRDAMIDVVENGTARRVRGAFVDAEGNPLQVGGKTGTGDHRFETFGAGGKLVSSRVVSRTATFVFFIGERFFGVVTAHVKGPDAAQYNFTSALAAELLKVFADPLRPLIAGESSLSHQHRKIESTTTKSPN